MANLKRQYEHHPAAPNANLERIMMADFHKILGDTALIKLKETHKFRTTEGVLVTAETNGQCNKEKNTQPYSTLRHFTG